VSVDVALAVDSAHLDLDPDDRPLAAALRGRGLRTAVAAWDDPGFAWDRARLVLLRNPWDYFHRPAAFLDWAGRVAAATRLWNPLPAVRWNLHKGYLAELAERGAPVVPTVVLPRTGPPGDGPGGALLHDLLADRGWERAVVKPAISADSWETKVVPLDEAARGQRELDRLRSERDVLVQPFLPSVETTGERCLVFLDGVFSHAVRKNSLTRGGRWAGEPEGRPVEATADELEAARTVLAAAGFADLLYARVDLVRDGDGRPLLLELELIEPTLFLADHPAGLARLLDALERRLPAETAGPDAGRPGGGPAPGSPAGREPG
jgi:hypothetical protein